MRLPSRQRLAVFLMLLSMGGLLLFLFMFLKKVYEDELATVKKETGLLFINAVRGIEGEMFDKIIARHVGGNGPSEATLTLQIPPAPKPDSLRVVTFFTTEQVASFSNDSAIRIQIRKEKTPPVNQTTEGRLSVFMKMSGDSLITNRTFSTCDTTEVLSKIRENFTKAMANSDLDIGYEIIQLNNRDSLDENVLLAGSYTDLSSGAQYGVEITGYRKQVFRSMFMQFMFAVQLLCLVALAFWFIYQTMIQQQQLAEQKSDFIRNVTHELKTPIATVSVAIEAMQNFDALGDPARTREYLDISKIELARLSLLVDKVLRMSLFEKGAPELKLEPIDFKALVEEILNSMKLQFEKYGARVALRLSGGDFSLLGDRVHLSGVVYNLLDNALKYSLNKPIIDIDLDGGNEQLTLQVRDQGKGIPEVFLEKIFDKFFRVPSGDIHNVKGHGLGLSYVAGVVGQHQGRIWVESGEGLGACFTIQLPKGPREPGKNKEI